MFGRDAMASGKIGEEASWQRPEFRIMSQERPRPKPERTRIVGNLGAEQRGRRYEEDSWKMYSGPLSATPKGGTRTKR